MVASARAGSRLDCARRHTRVARRARNDHGSGLTLAGASVPVACLSCQGRTRLGATDANGSQYRRQAAGRNVNKAGNFPGFLFRAEIL